MKTLHFLSFNAAIFFTLHAGIQASPSMSDTAYSLSDTVLAVSAKNSRTGSNTFQDNLAAKRMAALKSKSDRPQTCEGRKRKAMEQRERMQLDGIAETAPEWRKINRTITFLNGRCPGFNTAAQLFSSICERRESALAHKLRSLKSAGVSPGDDEFLSTKEELAVTRQKCTANSVE